MTAIITKSIRDRVAPLVIHSNIEPPQSLNTGRLYLGQALVLKAPVSARVYFSWAWKNHLLVTPHLRLAMIRAQWDSNSLRSCNPRRVRHVRHSGRSLSSLSLDSHWCHSRYLPSVLSTVCASLGGQPHRSHLCVTRCMNSPRRRPRVGPPILVYK